MSGRGINGNLAVRAADGFGPTEWGKLEVEPHYQRPRVDWGPLNPQHLSFEQATTLSLSAAGGEYFGAVEKRCKEIAQSETDPVKNRNVRLWGEILHALLTSDATFPAVYVIGSGEMNGGLGRQKFNDGQVFLQLHTETGLKVVGFSPQQVMDLFVIQNIESRSDNMLAKSFVAISDMYQVGFQVPEKSAGVRCSYHTGFGQ